MIRTCSFSKEEWLKCIENYLDKLLVIYYNPDDLTEEDIKEIKKEVHTIHSITPTHQVPRGKIIVTTYENVKPKPLKFCELRPEITEYRLPKTVGVWNNIVDVCNKE